ncbi:hypothetical protein METBIDRAFT_43754 [Metschnikowia bicuspidata var. bicuspidata NRRL YB-4993]|uniref:Zinc finger CHCC-type domain-containing protein n=1 Tax=Metschnikowia bicuspidata var. bicuspidata NRRL YB-4993 TaxID=869754 RepID=A0A1A0H9J0_9ASCO|nr:hypothetical protein METBIDRAFT_43754 [Metschnikowia bicuspidata var. bicuspidata NRRL YB-4993]OBA20543.1 hypothetical protein METBIDRAFT_43754 [Metschnikowia bicuspidata var. bicuspidata NRRL YB-4993]
MLGKFSIKALVRYQSTAINATKSSVTGLKPQELAQNPSAMPAPNRKETWTPSQAPRADVISTHPHRFIQRNLDEQPQPYAAIDLIAKEPIRFLHEGNIAVCDGNKGSTLQGHPKVFINLDQPKASTCGYCGLRYAKDEYRDLIESTEA